MTYFYNWMTWTKLLSYDSTVEFFDKYVAQKVTIPLEMGKFLDNIEYFFVDVGLSFSETWLVYPCFHDCHV